MKIEFSTDNAAFCDPVTQEENPKIKAVEISLILKYIAGLIRERGEISGTVIDSNGNEIGFWDIDM